MSRPRQEQFPISGPADPTRQLTPAQTVTAILETRHRSRDLKRVLHACFWLKPSVAETLKYSVAETFNKHSESISTLFPSSLHTKQ